MRDASSSFARASPVRQRQRRAPFPGTTSIPVPKQYEQTIGSVASEKTCGGCEELLSSSSLTAANLRAFEPVNMKLLSSSHFPSLPPSAESKEFAFSRTLGASSGSRNPPASALISESVTSTDCPLVSSSATQAWANSATTSSEERRVG